MVTYVYKYINFEEKKCSFEIYCKKINKNDLTAFC